MSEPNTTPSPHEDPGAGEENIGEQQMQAMSMLGGASRPEGLPRADDSDFADVDGAGGSGISQSTILVVVVLVIAVGSLYAMRLTQGDLSDTDSQIEAKIEQTLIKLGNPEAMSADSPLRPENLQALFRDTDQIISTLEIDLTGRQVPSDEIQKNPFELAIDRSQPADPDAAAGRRQAELERLREELSQLNLQSVMGDGDGAIAVIGGEFYQVGQTVGSFEITAVDGSNSTVQLTAADETFVLKMGE
ncbi:MAG: hypothetical protein ACODAQ_10325 [Phycisphaeraceae bacterium]